MDDMGVNGKTAIVNDASVVRKRSPESNGEEAKLRKACADFESLFVYKLFQSMRKTIPVGNQALQSFSRETYTAMFDQKVAEELSGKGEGIGLQGILFKQLNQSGNRK